MDVPGKSLELRVPETEIQRRLAAWKPPSPHYRRGYGKMFLDHILQAHEGCDFDFLRGYEREDGETPLRRFPNPAL